MDIVRAFTFLSDDQEWPRRLGIGMASLLTFGLGSALWFVAAPYLAMVAGHIFGQIGRDSAI